MQMLVNSIGPLSPPGPLVRLSAARCRGGGVAAAACVAAPARDSLPHVVRRWQWRALMDGHGGIQSLKFVIFLGALVLYQNRNVKKSIYCNIFAILVMCEWFLAGGTHSSCLCVFVFIAILLSVRTQRWFGDVDQRTALHESISARRRDLAVFDSALRWLTSMMKNGDRYADD